MEPLDKTLIAAPFDDRLSPKRRTHVAIKMSELVMKVATYVICHTIVDYQELLKYERISIAHAFLQRATSTHLCNHKLTTEGIVYRYRGETFHLHEEYRTMTLTRSVYEHLAMFYFLFEHPKSIEEAEIVWKYWLINSKKNKIGINPGDSQLIKDETKEARQEIKELKKEILSTRIGMLCHKELNDLLNNKSTQTGSIEFIRQNEKYSVNRLSFSQAWKYLYHETDDGILMALQYRYLSMHSHPVYDGLCQYQEQSNNNQGEEAVPLYLSCSFVAQLCLLFLKQLPDGLGIIEKEFSPQELSTFMALSQMNSSVETNSK
jgi:hypothetical protein